MSHAEQHSIDQCQISIDRRREVAEERFLKELKLYKKTIRELTEEARDLRARRTPSRQSASRGSGEN